MWTPWRKEMKALSMLEGATYDPKTLKAICQAFDEAWAGIAELYDYPGEAEHARLGLAKSVLAVSPEHGSDVEALKSAALQHFALNYRDSSAPSDSSWSPLG
jgi:hypothetical protein